MSSPTLATAIPAPQTLLIYLLSRYEQIAARVTTEFLRSPQLTPNPRS